MKQPTAPAPAMAIGRFPQDGIEASFFLYQKDLA
jgi:hypothetical protein